MEEEFQEHSLTPPSGKQETSTAGSRGGWTLFLEGCHSGVRSDSDKAQKRKPVSSGVQGDGSKLWHVQLSQRHSKDQGGRKAHALTPVHHI